MAIRIRKNWSGCCVVAADGGETHYESIREAVNKTRIANLPPPAEEAVASLAPSMGDASETVDVASLAPSMGDASETVDVPSARRYSRRRANEETDQEVA